MTSQKSKMFAVARSGSSMLYKECPIPNCGPNEVLIKVKAAAINPLDYKLRWPIGNAIVGLDFSGIIDQLGSNVQSFQVGNEVYGKCKGSLAEYTVADASEIAVKASNISYEEAACMPITYLTGLQALRDYGQLKEGGSVLIIGASGGCGVAGVQIAKYFGASEIVGVCSEKNAEFVKAQGATEIIDYNKDDVVDYCSEDGELKKAFDVVYDCATNSGGGEDYKERSLKLLKKEATEQHGQYVAINGSAGMWLRLFTIGQKENQHLFLTNFNTSDLDCLTQLVENDKVKPFIGKQLVLNAESMKEGFDLLKSRRSVGKIVFQVN